MRGRAEIGVRVGRVVNKYKVAKHVMLTITDTASTFTIREAQSPPRRSSMVST